MFLWRTDENYPSIIINQIPSLSVLLTVQTQIRLLLNWVGPLFAIPSASFGCINSTVKPSCSNFIVVTANILGVQIFRSFMVIPFHLPVLSTKPVLCKTAVDLGIWLLTTTIDQAIMIMTNRADTAVIFCMYAEQTGLADSTDWEIGTILMSTLSRKNKNHNYMTERQILSLYPRAGFILRTSSSNLSTLRYTLNQDKTSENTIYLIHTGLTCFVCLFDLWFYDPVNTLR